MKEFPNKAWAVAGQDGVLITFDEQNACALAGDHMPVETYVKQRSLAETAEVEMLSVYRITMQTVIEQQLTLCAYETVEYERTSYKICLATIFDSPAARHAVTDVDAARTPMLADMLEKAGNNGEPTDLVVMCGRYIDKHLCR